MQELLNKLRQEIEEGKYPIVMPSPGRLAALNRVTPNVIRTRVYGPLKAEGLIVREGKNFYVVPR